MYTDVRPAHVPSKSLRCGEHHQAQVESDAGSGMANDKSVKAWRVSIAARWGMCRISLITSIALHSGGSLQSLEL